MKVNWVQFLLSVFILAHSVCLCFLYFFVHIMTVNGVQKLDYVPQKTKFYRFVMMNKSLHEFSFLGELMKEN